MQHTVARIVLVFVLSLPLAARADIPIDDPDSPGEALSDFERGERIGRVIGGCACPACCGLVAIGAIGGFVYVSRKKKQASP